MIVVFVLFLLWSGAAFAQTNTPTAPSLPNNQTEMLEHWRRSTISVGQIIDDGGKKQYRTVGSAVIIAVDSTHGCLLTAKHVLYDPDKGYTPTSMRIRPPRNNLSPFLDFGIETPLIINGQNLWRSLSDGSDLAVVPLPNLSKYTDIHGISPADFAIESDVFQGASIIVLGYPALAGEDALQWPLARGGIIAWVDPTDKLGKPFLVDANFFNGNSGGPVFRLRNGMDQYGSILLGGGLSLIGIVSKDFFENAPVKVGEQPILGIDQSTGRPAAAVAQVLNIGGLGLIEPISRARKLIDEHCGKPISASSPSIGATPGERAPR